MKENYIIVAGTFDLFHKGHVRLLKRARQYGKVIALVNTDRFVKEFKKKKPIINEKDRLEVIASCRYVDVSGYNDWADLKIAINKFLKKYNVVGVAFGDDYNIESYRKQTKITPKWQSKHNIALIQLPRTPKISSSGIKSCIM